MSPSPLLGKGQGGEGSKVWQGKQRGEGYICNTSFLGPHYLYGAGGSEGMLY